MIISLLCPTRGRPSNVIRLVASAVNHSVDPKQLEFVFYLDNDDVLGAQGVNSAIEQFPGIKIKMVVGERILMSNMWNVCHENATGEIFMHCGDDIEFKTPEWDTLVRDAFAAVPDKIVFVHGTDGWNVDNFGTHGFLHQNWVKAVGHFVPPLFSSDFNDTWLNDVANQIGRRRYVNVLTDHYHPLFGKGPLDQTHIDRLERHRQDHVEDLYTKTAPLREIDALKLRNFILEFELNRIKKLYLIKS